MGGMLGSHVPSEKYVMALLDRNSYVNDDGKFDKEQLLPLWLLRWIEWRPREPR